MTAYLRCDRGYFLSGVGVVPVFLSIPLLSPLSFSGVLVGEAGLDLAAGDGLVPGLPVGEAVGEPVGAAGELVAAGDEVTAGLGLVAGLFCVVLASVQAPRKAAEAAKTVSRTDLLIVFTSIRSGRIAVFLERPQPVCRSRLGCLHSRMRV